MQRKQIQPTSEANKSIQSHENSLTRSRAKLKRTNTTLLQPKLTKTPIKHQIDSFDESRSAKYTPIKNKHLKISDNLNDKNSVASSVSKNNHNQGQLKKNTDVDKKGPKDSQHYYKFWKTKANQYQQMNFNLQRINSALQQQLQIVKHHNQKLQKKLNRHQSPQLRDQFADPLQKDKIEKFYNLKIDSLTKKIGQQQIIIKKQDQKIRQLSKQMLENHKLKNFIDNIQDKVSEINSIDDDKKSTSSRRYSIKKVVIPPVQINSLNNVSHKTIRKANTYRYHIPDDAADDFSSPKHDTISIDDQFRSPLLKSRSNQNLNANFQSETQIRPKFNMF